MNISDVASIVLAVSGTFSLIYIARQVAVTRQQTKGQFLLSLDESFAKARELYMKLNAEPNFVPEGEDWPRIWSLMSVFERISIMVADKILDVEIVERLYGYVLMGLIANDAIFERLQSTGAEWKDFIELCQAIAKKKRRAKVGPRHAKFLERVSTLDKEAMLLKDPWKY